jgi:uncharacterized RDD family membrane protein YckC
MSHSIAQGGAGAQPAGLGLRLAAMIYEGVLLFGVTFVVAFALLSVLSWKYPLMTTQRTVLQVALFLAIGVYFVWCWTRSGQTLALKTWRLRIAGPDGAPPSTPRAVVRYLLAWHLFLPGLVFIAFADARPAVGLAALAAGFSVLLLPALLDRDRRLLHDRWSGTRVLRDD